MDELLRAIASHLEYFGYRVLYEQGILKVSHPTFVPFWVLPQAEGALFRTVYTIGEPARLDPTGFLAFLNRANEISTISRYVLREQVMCVEGWFPGHYDKAAFAAFFRQYLADIQAPVVQEAALVLKFFPS